MEIWNTNNAYYTKSEQSSHEHHFFSSILEKNHKSAYVFVYTRKKRYILIIHFSTLINVKHLASILNLYSINGASVKQI